MDVLNTSRRAGSARFVVLGVLCRHPIHRNTPCWKSSWHFARWRSKRASDLLPMIEAIRIEGAASLRQIAGVLNERGIPTARGGERSAVQVARVLSAA
jgi:hypothetical protein